MSYLDTARAARTDCEISEISPLHKTSGRCEEGPDCEKSEICEKSPVLPQETPFLTPDKAEALKARIIAALDVEPDQFDRAHYLRLWTLWKAQDAKEESTL